MFKPVRVRSASVAGHTQTPRQPSLRSTIMNRRPLAIKVGNLTRLDWLLYRRRDGSGVRRNYAGLDAHGRDPFVFPSRSAHAVDASWPGTCQCMACILILVSLLLYISQFQFTFCRLFCWDSELCMRTLHHKNACFPFWRNESKSKSARARIFYTTLINLARGSRRNLRVCWVGAAGFPNWRQAYAAR